MDKLKLVLPGSIRSKKNSKVATVIGGVNKPRRAIILPSKAHQAWEKIAKQAAAEQFPHRSPISSDVHIRAVAYIKGAMPDLSGMTESVGDCIQGVVIADDKQIKSWDGSRVLRDKHNPRTLVEIMPYTEDDSK